MNFDCVWNNGVNEHFLGNDRQLVFNEMARVCKIGGYLLITVPNSLNPLYRIKKKFLELRKKWPFGFEQPFSHEELKLRMRKAGIEILNKDGYGFLDSIFAMVPRKKVRRSINYRLKRLELLLSLILFLRNINYKKAFYNTYFGFIILQSGKRMIRSSIIFGSCFTGKSNSSDDT